MAEPLIPNFPSFPELVTMSAAQRLSRLKQAHAHALARGAIEAWFGTANPEACGQALHNFETSRSDTDTLQRTGLADLLRDLVHVQTEEVEIVVPESALFGLHWYISEEVAELHPLVVASWPEPDCGRHSELLLPLTGDIQEFTEQQLALLTFLADGKEYAATQATY